MKKEWNETTDARSLTVVIPNNVDISKDDIEEAVQDVIEGENDVTESNDDDMRRFERGYKC
jgi:hypothetical protein